MAVLTEQLIQDVVRLHKADKYKEILEIFHNVISDGTEKDKTTLHLLLWPAPTQEDLMVLNGFIISRHISHVYSIGCGTGLLEWLLLQANAHISSASSSSRADDDDNGCSEPSTHPCDIQSGVNASRCSIELTGVEVDSEWWTNKYAPPVFLPQKYAGEDFPQGVPFGTDKDLIIFSYFNSVKICAEYLNLFRGAYVIIIGPTQKQYCAPSPMDLTTHPDLPTIEWNLILHQRFGLEPFDYIAIYSKAEKTPLYQLHLYNN